MVEEAEWEVIQRMKESDEAKKAIELTVSQTDNVQKEAPPAPKKEALPAPKPAPVEEPEEAEEAPIEEPKKAAPKKAAAPASESSSLEDLIGEWDD